MLTVETFKLCVLTTEVSLLGQNTAVRGLVLTFVTCQILHGIVGEQKMAELPKKSFSNNPPLSHFGVDVFRLIFSKGEEGRIKQYGTMASQSVHIEITYTLDANSFIHSGI